MVVCVCVHMRLLERARRQCGTGCRGCQGCATQVPRPSRRGSEAMADDQRPAQRAEAVEASEVLASFPAAHHPPSTPLVTQTALPLQGDSSTDAVPSVGILIALLVGIVLVLTLLAIACCKRCARGGPQRRETPFNIAPHALTYAAYTQRSCLSYLACTHRRHRQDRYAHEAVENRDYGRGCAHLARGARQHGAPPRDDIWSRPKFSNGCRVREHRQAQSFDL